MKPGGSPPCYAAAGRRARGERWAARGAMPPAGRLLLAALALQAVAAFEPVSVAIAVGAASALTGYLSYKDLYCRFAECCREKPLNASGTAAGRPGGARGARGPGPCGRQDGSAQVGGGRGRTGPRPGLQAWKPCVRDGFCRPCGAAHVPF